MLGGITIAPLLILRQQQIGERDFGSFLINEHTDSSAGE
jgi:hypothetical protein